MLTLFFLRDPDEPYSDDGLSASFVGGVGGVLNVVRCPNATVPCMEGDIAG